MSNEERAKDTLANLKGPLGISPDGNPLYSDNSDFNISELIEEDDLRAVAKAYAMDEWGWSTNPLRAFMEMRGAAIVLSLMLVKEMSVDFSADRALQNREDGQEEIDPLTLDIFFPGIGDISPTLSDVPISSLIFDAMRQRVEMDREHLGEDPWNIEEVSGALRTLADKIDSLTESPGESNA